MNKFKVVLKHEFLNQVKNKVFLIITSLLILGVIVGSFFIRKSLDTETNIKDRNIYLFYESSALKNKSDDLDLSPYTGILIDKKKTFEQKTQDDKHLGLIFHNEDEVTLVNADSLDQSDRYLLENSLNQAYSLWRLSKATGLSSEKINALSNQRLIIHSDSNQEVINDDHMFNTSVTQLFTMILFMSITAFGNVVSSAIINEKTNKSMEVLITSSPAHYLVLGKVFGVGLSFVLIILLILLTIFICIKTVLSGVIDSSLISEFFSNLTPILPMTLYLLIVGFFSYLFLFAALSSFTHRPEDANTVLMPILVILMIIYFKSFALTTSSDISAEFATTSMRLISNLPLVSPFFSFFRYVGGAMSTTQVLFTVFLNLFYLFLLIFLSSKIYRAGSLYYGNKINLRTILKNSFSFDSTKS